MLDEFLAADAVALGTPDYFSYLAGTIKTFFDDIYQWNQAGEHVKGKPAALFFPHGGGGRVRQHLKDFADRFFNHVGEIVESRTHISNEAKKNCFALGQELANKVK